MYPYEVATMVEVLGRALPRHEPDGDQSPIRARGATRSSRLRLIAGYQLIRLGEALAGSRPATGGPHTAGATRS